MKIYEKRFRRGSISARRLFVLFTVFTLALLIAAA